MGAAESPRTARKLMMMVKTFEDFRKKWMNSSVDNELITDIDSIASWTLKEIDKVSEKEFEVAGQTDPYGQIERIQQKAHELLESEK